MVQKKNSFVHMGAVIGSETLKETYVQNKVNKWVEDVVELAKIADDEPQAAYASFTKAISHRWTYVQRTIPNISHLFMPLEDAIRNQLIPSLVGRKISQIEPRILALPVRLGGMGIRNPTMSSEEFDASSSITENLTGIIVNQESDFTNYNEEEVKKCINAVKTRKERRMEDELKQIEELVDEKTKRILELAQEKGSGAWLTALPIQALGYTPGFSL